MTFTRTGVATFVAALVAAAATTAGATSPPTVPDTIVPVAGAIPSLTGPNPQGCVDDWQGEPLFQDQFKVQYADNYQLAYYDNYKVLTVAGTDQAGPEQRYVLLQCGTDAPELTGELEGATVVDIPITSLYSASSSHLGFIDALSLTDRVTGFGQPDAVVMPSIRERIDAGEVAAFAPTFEVDVEVVLAGQPDVFISGGYDDPSFPTLRDAGIPVVSNIDWLETTPQGWSEWIGLFAALTNTEGRAMTTHNAWIREYDEAAAQAARATERPTVVDGSLFEGTWYRTGGNSIRAQFIADAGGDYLFADDPSTGTVESDIETILATGADADVWVGVSDDFATKSEAIALDSRYGQFAAWDGLGVFSTNVGPDPRWSYAESGPTMIGPYLLDYVKAFHPELAPDHEPRFLGQVPND